QASLPIHALPEEVAPPARMGASRALAIGASKSATGNPILLQATADGPDIHISGGGFDAAGYTFPSMSPIAQGRTPYNAWSLTTGESDLVDVFAEKINPDNPRQYLHKGAWRNMDVRRETIQVKGAAPVIIEVERTVHGPVIRREAKENVAYSERNVGWGQELRGLSNFIDLSRVRNLADFQKTASRSPGSFNWNYAGVDKHIAMIHSGYLPLRANGVDPRLPTPGTGEYDWQGVQPELSAMVDPKQGYFHAWNNKATSQSFYGDSARYGKSFRTWLGRALVEADDKITYAEMQEIHRKIGRSSGGADLTVTNPKFFTPYLRTAVKGDPRLEAAVAAMDSWNGIYEDNDADDYYDSVGLTVYRKWIDTAQRSIVGDDIDSWWTDVDTAYIKYRTDVLLRAVEGSDAGTPVTYDWFNGVDRNQKLRETVAATVNALETEYGSADPAKWRHRAFYRYYDAAALTPDKPTRRGGAGASRLGGVSLMAGPLGLQPAAVPDNGSEGWNMLVEVKPADPTLYDSTPSGGQNLTITRDGKGNPNIADQVRLHETFRFKAVSLDPRVVKDEAVSTTRLKIPAK
ncbi:penicillin acylase family protein, partial [Phenylobacterium sp.]|uniref:penicillin acylase family protein n=1 Tax=Phenylobacterium sp. TaxID=1871053 RepID=UPI00378333B8